MKPRKVYLYQVKGRGAYTTRRYVTARSKQEAITLAMDSIPDGAATEIRVKMLCERDKIIPCTENL